MEREIIELRKQIATVQSGTGMPPQQQQPPSSIPTAQHTPKQEPSSQVSPAVYNTPSMSSDHYMGSHEAVASLLDLRSGFDGFSYMRNGTHHFKRLEDVVVVPERVKELFDLYVVFGHPFLVILSPNILTADFSRSIIRSSHFLTERKHRKITTTFLHSYSGPSLALALDVINPIPNFSIPSQAPFHDWCGVRWRTSHKATMS